jgi:ribose-phosphate pyrophosphokinase
MSVCILSFHESVLAPALAKELSVPHKKIFPRLFSDGEFALEMATCRDLQHTVVVADFSCVGNERIHIEILAITLLIKQLAAEGIQELTLVMPYLPYTRARRPDVTSMGVLLDQLARFKKTAVLAFDVHDESHIWPGVTPLWTDDLWLQQAAMIVQGKDAVVVSPDAGGAARAMRLAELLQLPAAVMEKYREDSGDISMEELSQCVAGKTILLRDDIVATGQTATLAAKVLKSQGAAQVFGLFTHAVLSNGAEARLQQAAFDGIFFTNSLIKLPMPFATIIDLASSLSSVLRLKINKKT